MSQGEVTFNGLTEHERGLVNAIAEKAASLINRPVWQKIPKTVEVIDGDLFFERCKKKRLYAR